MPVRRHEAIRPRPRAGHRGAGRLPGDEVRVARPARLSRARGGITMSVAEPPKAGTKMTVEEFLALPDNGVERALIRGELREYGAVPYRNRFHARVEVVIST